MGGKFGKEEEKFAQRKANIRKEDFMFVNQESATLSKSSGYGGKRKKA